VLVVSQNGQVWWVGDGFRSVKPVLDLAGRVSLGAERGLLGLAIHPNYPADPRIFIDFTDTDGTIEVASYELPPGDEAVRPGSEKAILRIPHPQPIHNAGALAFGPGGYLYVAVGDGGLDPALQQRPAGLLGKILRLDIDHPSAGRLYSIPPDNPYANAVAASNAPAGETGATASAQPDVLPPETWLSGFRNPWRFSFDPQTGDLWIGDVGADTWEEVDVVRAGANGFDFGWPITEGFHCFAGTACQVGPLTPPVAEYRHGPDCAIAGGQVYRGTAIPALAGDYVFGDYCSGRIYAIAANGGSVRQEPRVIAQSPGGVAAFGVSANGELYVANVNDGAISRILPLP
jgi:glucose/arabinose dehydrogenase